MSAFEELLRAGPLVWIAIYTAAVLAGGFVLMWLGELWERIRKRK